MYNLIQQYLLNKTNNYQYTFSYYKNNNFKDTNFHWSLNKVTRKLQSVYEKKVNVSKQATP